MTRGRAKGADYILYYRPNIPLAVIEAKDNHCSVGDGMQQALEYAQTLQILFVFSSNGDAFVFHDRTATSGAIETNLQLHEFPAAAVLWRKYREWKGLPPEAEPIVLQDYYSDASRRDRRITSRARSTPRLKRSQRVRIASCSSWPRAPERRTPPFKSSGACGRLAGRSAFSFLADRNVLIDQLDSFIDPEAQISRHRQNRGSCPPAWMRRPAASSRSTARSDR